VTSEADDENLIYLNLGDALEIYAAIFKLNGEQRPPITYEARTR
jgi:hypothetical protein